MEDQDYIVIKTRERERGTFDSRYKKQTCSDN